MCADDRSKARLSLEHEESVRVDPERCSGDFGFRWDDRSPAGGDADVVHLKFDWWGCSTSGRDEDLGRGEHDAQYHDTMWSLLRFHS
jgi:hypothetical protein